ncbi:MAG: AAA family ATPase [Proteobacteria bacterium]|nr:AAA family ATPase [Pseudomonadota bacterium]
MINRNPLVGHKKAQETIIKLISENKLPHAILLHGMEGIGKAKFAEALALMLICGVKPLSHKDKFSYDDESANFSRIEAGSLKEFSVIAPLDGKKQISIEQVRVAIGDLSLTSDNRRVIIINTADDLNQSSANAILKTLEEPPSDTFLILISNSPAKLLPTINSRCRKIKLDPLGLHEIEQVLEQEEIKSDKLDQALQFCSGSVSKAIQFLNIENAILDKLDNFFDIKKPSSSDVLAIAEELSNKKFNESLVYTQIKDIISAACKKSMGLETNFDGIKCVENLATRNSQEKLTHVYNTIVETEENRNALNLSQVGCLESIFSKLI